MTNSREATFIESEALAALTGDYHVELTGVESRRNFTTRGVALNHLVGRQFKVRGGGLSRHPAVRALRGS